MPWAFSQALAIGGRNEQQDRIAILHAEGTDTHLLILADGAGGHGNGALAAQTVIDTAVACFTPGATAEPDRLVIDICLAAHQAVIGLPSGGGLPPASTCVVLLLRSRDAHWAHVGDSRLYLLRGEQTLFQTEDHSHARFDLHADGARPNKKLYMSIGAGREIQPETESVRVDPGDQFLLCSDGFWNQVSIDRVASALAQGPLDQQTAQGWVDRANRAGGARADNISLLLARYLPDSAAGRWDIATRLRAWLGRMRASRYRRHPNQ